MKFTFLTIFPDLIEQYLNTSIAKRAFESDVIETNIINIRDFSLDKYKTIDDHPFGGGDGMVMMITPIYKALQSVLPPGEFESLLNKNEINDCAVILMTPKGNKWNQETAMSFAKEFKHIIFIIPHFEGIDERVVEHLCTHEISIGDYIVTGGELPSLVLTDSIIRLLPGALGNDHSSVDESFHNNLLEYSQYTRPSKFENDGNIWEVPEILLSGNHAKIKKWRDEQSREITKIRRPDL